MKDFLFVSVTVGRKNTRKLIKILKDLNLSKIVHLDKFDIITGSCSFKLPSEDKRIHKFIAQIKDNKLNDNPFVRADREYSQEELGNAQWLLLWIKTAGLYNPKDNQVFDKTKACSDCGTGAMPIPPLLISANQMGKKMIDHTVHAGLLIFNKELSKKIVNSGFTGIEFHQAILGKEKEQYMWGKVTSSFPPLHTKSVVKKRRVCNLCSRGGYFSVIQQVRELWYDNKNLFKFNQKDFNTTYEYFGTPYEYIGEKGRKLGGRQLIIISQRTRQFFIKEKVRLLSFEPIFLI
jgi:ribosomal protein S27AE